MTIIRLTSTGRDLSLKLAESIDVIERYGPEWLAEVHRAQRAFPGARLVHTSELPTEDVIWPLSI